MILPPWLLARARRKPVSASRGRYAVCFRHRARRAWRSNGRRALIPLAPRNCLRCGRGFTCVSHLSRPAGSEQTARGPAPGLHPLGPYWVPPGPRKRGASPGPPHWGMARPWKNPGRLGAARTAARVRIRDSLVLFRANHRLGLSAPGPGDTPLHCRGGERGPLGADADRPAQGREYPTQGHLLSTTSHSTTPLDGGPGGGGAPHEWTKPRSHHRAVQSTPQPGETPPHKGSPPPGRTLTFLHRATHQPTGWRTRRAEAPHEWSKPRSHHRAVQSAPQPGETPPHQGSPPPGRTLAFLHRATHQPTGWRAQRGRGSPRMDKAPIPPPGGTERPSTRGNPLTLRGSSTGADTRISPPPPPPPDTRGLGGISTPARKRWRAGLRTAAPGSPSLHAGTSPTRREHPKGGGPYSTAALRGWPGPVVFSTVQPFSGPPKQHLAIGHRPPRQHPQRSRAVLSTLQRGEPRWPAPCGAHGVQKQGRLSAFFLPLPPQIRVGAVTADHPATTAGNRTVRFQCRSGRPQKQSGCFSTRQASSCPCHVPIPRLPGGGVKQCRKGA